jgi:hypothetical protein
MRKQVIFCICSIPPTPTLPHPPIFFPHPENMLIHFVTTGLWINVAWSHSSLNNIDFHQSLRIIKWYADSNCFYFLCELLTIFTSQWAVIVFTRADQTCTDLRQMKTKPFSSISPTLTILWNQRQNKDFGFIKYYINFVWENNKSHFASFWDWEFSNYDEDEMTTADNIAWTFHHISSVSTFVLKASGLYRERVWLVTHSDTWVFSGCSGFLPQ